MSEEFKIKISSGADVSGSLKAAEALRDVGEASKESAGLVEELGRKGSSAKDVYEGLTQTLNGGTGAIFGIARAWRNLAAAFSSNPMGAVLAVSAALGPALYGVAKSLGLFGDAAKQAGGAASEAAPKLDAFGEALRKSGGAKLKELNSELSLLKENAKGAADELARVMALKERLEKATAAEKVATINADPDLTPEQKKHRLYLTEQESVNTQRANEDLKLGQEYQAAKDNAARMRAKADEIEAERAQAAARAKDAEERRVALADERRALESERDAIKPSETVASRRARGLSGGRAEEIESRLKQIADEEASNEAVQGYIDAQKKRAEALEGLADKAAKDAEEIEERLRRLGQGIVGLRPDGSAIIGPEIAIARGVEDKARRKAAGIPEPVSRAGSTTTVESDVIGEVDGRRISRRFDSGAGPAVTIDTHGIAESGRETGREIARRMEEALRARDARMIEEMLNQIKALRR